MSSKNRIKQLLDKLEKESVVYTNDLVKEFEVSEATIRRDLASLDKDGKLKRIPGGAVKVSSSGVLMPNEEIKMHQRLSINTAAKKNICEMAAKEVQDGECIFIDGGSSLMYMIDYLKDKNIRIVTHNHLIISKLADDTNAQIITLGGTYLSQYAMSVGADTIRQLNQFSFDRCFIGCAGIDLDEQMSYTTESETKEIKAAAIASSDHKYLLIDHTKIGVRAFCKFETLDSFEKIFCDLPQTDVTYPENFVFVEGK